MVNVTALVAIVGAAVTIFSLLWGIAGDRSRIRYLERVSNVAKDLPENGRALIALTSLQDELAENMLERYSTSADVVRRNWRRLAVSGILCLFLLVSGAISTSLLPLNSPMQLVVVLPQGIALAVAYVVALISFRRLLGLRRLTRQTRAAKRRSAGET